MKARNYHYYGSQVEVDRLAEEYRFLGRHVIVEPNHLTVLAYPIKKVKKKDESRGQNSAVKAESSGEDRPTRQNARPQGSRAVVRNKS